MRKPIVDIIASICVLVAIVTGIMLHIEIHHTYIYDDTLLWTLHSVAAIMLVAMIVVHALQHKFWFKNYARISVAKKHATTIFLGVSAVVLFTGVPLLLGSHSNIISMTHFVAGILFTVLAIGHVAKRFKIFRGLISR